MQWNFSTLKYNTENYQSNSWKIRQARKNKHKEAYLDYFGSRHVESYATQ